jgi:hypothetical protein
VLEVGRDTDQRDGFCVGWYGARQQPGLFRSIRPAWNDFNLREIAAQVESLLLLGRGHTPWLLARVLDSDPSRGDMRGEKQPRVTMPDRGPCAANGGQS